MHVVLHNVYICMYVSTNFGGAKNDWGSCECGEKLLPTRAVVFIRGIVRSEEVIIIIVIRRCTCMCVCVHVCVYYDEIYCIDERQ